MLQRTGWADGVGKHLVYCSVAGTVPGGSPELHMVWLVDGEKVDLAWQAPYSEAARSLQRTSMADGL